MQILQATPAAQRTTIATSAPARAAAAPQRATRTGPSAASIANGMVSAPEAVPLSAIPTDWVPMGTSQRRVDTRTGLLVLERGNVRVTRNESSINVQQLDNKNIANVTLRVDPADPRSVIAATPLGQFRGRLSGGNNNFAFQGDDGRHNIRIGREGNHVRFDTQGFGVIDHGHLNVYDPR